MKKNKLQRIVVPEPAQLYQVEADRQKAQWINSPALLCRYPICDPFYATCDYSLVIRKSLAVCGIILLAHGIPLLTLSRNQRRRFP